MVTRRNFLISSGTLAFTAATAGLWASTSMPSQAATGFEITKSASQWKSLLGSARYRVLREEGTERPNSSALNKEKRVGTFHCAGCDLPVYPSSTKFESGTGWPSFYKSLPNAIGTQSDNSFFMKRTEIHCRRCGGHFGHMFNDGPAPTGKRHCLNGLSLTFKAA